MRCPICEQDAAVISRIGKTYGRGETLLVIENVPAVSCHNCGSVTFTAATVKTLDKLRQEQEQFAIRRVVPVAVFPDVEDHEGSSHESNALKSDSFSIAD